VLYVYDSDNKPQTPSSVRSAEQLAMNMLAHSGLMLVDLPAVPAASQAAEDSLAM
jgi:hypothetical protein